jgi:hypothetical protein
LSKNCVGSLIAQLPLGSLCDQPGADPHVVVVWGLGRKTPGYLLAILVVYGDAVNIQFLGLLDVELDIVSLYVSRYLNAAPVLSL